MHFTFTPLWLLCLIHILFFCISPSLTLTGTEITDNENYSLTPPVATAVKNAIEYYNLTMMLHEHVQSFTKYYDKDNPEFLISKNPVLPVILKEALKLLENVEFEVKTKKRFDTSKIIKIEDKLGDYKTFMANDSLAINMRASAKLEKHWERLFDEFTTWTKLQADLVEGHDVLKEHGINLSPPNARPNYCMVVKDEDISNGKYKANANTKYSNIHDPEIDEIFKNKGDIPIQTSQEILALERYLNYGEIDPVSKGLLEGYLIAVNAKCFQIMKKLVEIETLVEDLTDSSQTYANYVIDQRDAARKRVQELKKKYFAKDEL